MSVDKVMTGTDSTDVLVRRVDLAEATLVAEILTDAFAGDPVAKWITPDPAYPGWFWPLLLPFMLPHGEVYLAGDGLGAAMWLPPGVDPGMKLGLGVLWDYWRRFGLRAVLRFFRLIIATEKHHPGDPHYYLFAVGVHAEAKGRGIGSALLEPVLRRCDDQGVPAYVENSNPRNLSFYQRHGFEVTNEIALSKNGPRLCLMYRQPGAGRA